MNLASNAASLIENLDKLEDPLSVLKALSVHAPVGVQIYNAAGYTIFTNEQHARIFGAPPPLGYCVLEDEHVRAAGTLHLVHKAFAGEPTTLPLLWYDPRELKHLLSPEELEYVQRVGKRAAIETHMVPVFDEQKKVSHVIFIFKDVTAELYMQESQQRALKERDDAKFQVQAVLENTKAVVYIKTTEGKYTFANGQFCRIFQKKAEEVLGKTDHDLFPKALADKFRAADLAVIQSKAHKELEEVAVHSDGSTHTYISLKFPLEDSAGALYGICGISTDITQHRQMERELGTAKRMEAVGLLAGGIAHDYNNILGIILLVADTFLLPGASQKPDVRASMETIKSVAQRAALLTRQLLAFGRRQVFQPRILDLGAVIQEMKAILSKALGEDIEFSVEVAQNLWAVRADPIQVEQVLTNLIFNARDAMPKGGQLKVALRNTSLSKGAIAKNLSGDFVELTVTDSGTGIEPEVLERIFEPFFTTKKEGQGSGLGLSTVYGIAQGMGGEVLVESALGIGTTFRLFLPRQEAATEAASAMLTKIKPLRGTETLLLVEDQAELRSVTAAMLRERGYKVYEAGNGNAALESWKKISGKVELIISDIVMPGMSGLDMLQAMEKNGAKSSLRALFVSGYSEKKLSAYEFDHKKFLLIEKPYTAIDLLTKIRDALNYSQSGKG